MGTNRADHGNLARFNPARALGYIRDLCAIGPRPSGSPGMLRQRKFLLDHLEPLCDRLTIQPFVARVPSQTLPIDMANIVASWYPDRTARVLLCSHYDTRPIADREPDLLDRTRPFLGANDGGSSTAFLMELARHLHNLETRVGVDLVFFDGEEFIHDRRTDHYFLGSSHFARQLAKLESPLPLAAILLDMIAGESAEFPFEQYALHYAPQLTRHVWSIAARLGCSAFLPEVGHAVQDDHLPLLSAGVPATAIIDIEYPHWHLLSDTPEHCSAEPLGQVARVIVDWLRLPSV